MIIIKRELAALQLKIDLHVHSCYSGDGLSTPLSIIKRIKERHLGGIAITDHNNCQCWRELTALGKKESVVIVKGEEIKVKVSGRTVGEVIGFFMNEEIKPASFDEIVDALNSQGAIAAIPHPFDWFRTPFKDLDNAIKRVSIIEVFNSRCVFHSMNRKASKYAGEHGLIGIAGSDAHTPWEIGNAFVECMGQSEEELRKAILRGKVKPGGRLSSPLFHVFSPIAKAGLIKRI